MKLETGNLKLAAAIRAAMNWQRWTILGVLAGVVLLGLTQGWSRDEWVVTGAAFLGLGLALLSLAGGQACEGANVQGCEGTEETGHGRT